MIVGILGAGRREPPGPRALVAAFGERGHHVRTYGGSAPGAMWRLWRERPRPDVLLWLGGGTAVVAGAWAEKWLTVPGVWLPGSGLGRAGKAELAAATQARRVVVSSSEHGEQLTARVAVASAWQAEFLRPRLETVSGREGAELATALDEVLQEAALPAPRVWMVSPAPWSRGGVADVARQVLVSPLSSRWRMAAVPTYVSGSTAVRLWWALWGTVSASLGLMFRKPDLVHLKVASRGSFVRKLIITVLCRLRRVPVLVHIHGGGFDQFVRRSPAPVRRAARWLVEEAPLVLSLSERWAEKLRVLFPRARIEAIPNPVEAHRYDGIAERRLGGIEARRRNGARRALFLGDIVERKGVFDLLEAWPAVVRECPSARLVLAGTGDLERVKRTCHSTGIESVVDVLGWVGFEEKYALLRDSDVFVLPSYIEGVPISLLEAMAAAVPSVVTPVGGVLDAVRPNHDALVIAAGDRSALTEAILSLFRDPELARRIGSSSRERVLTMDVGTYVARLDGYYREVLALPVARPPDAPVRGERGAKR